MEQGYGPLILNGSSIGFLKKLPHSLHHPMNLMILSTSSWPDGYTLQSTNASLNVKIMATTLLSPVKHHVHRVGKIAEQLHAETAILHQEFAEMKAVMDT